MFTLRCTKKLLSYMEATPMSGETSPTTALGDWYANLVPTCRGGIVICTNERTLLTVILPLMEGQHHPLAMFTMRVYNLLKLIGVPTARAEAELKEMKSVEIRKSQNRRVLGSMNEIALNLQLLAEDDRSGPMMASKGEMQIAQSIFTFTKYVPPAELALAILCADTSHVN